MKRDGRKIAAVLAADFRSLEINGAWRLPRAATATALRNLFAMAEISRLKRY